MMKEDLYGFQHQGVSPKRRGKWYVHAGVSPAGDNGRMDKLFVSTPFSQKRKCYHLTNYLLNSARRYHPQRRNCEMRWKN
jgi:hypothetical protein